jgi:hypothetical protein
VARVPGKLGIDVPRQQFFDTVDQASCDAGQHVPQITFRINPVQFCCSNQAIDCRGALATAIGSGKKKVFSAQCDATI